MMNDRTPLLGLVPVNLPFDPELDGWDPVDGWPDDDDGEPDVDDYPVDDGVLSRFWEGEHLAGNP